MGANTHGIDLTARAIEITKKRLSFYDLSSNLKVGDAENLEFSDNSFDFIYSWGVIHHSPDTQKAVDEIYRVLKPGGRFFCLEFSKILNSNLELLYKNYSKLIPLVGGLIVGEKKPYEYLVKSIENFVNQEELIALMEQNNFKKCSYRNLSGGIVSIHSGWKY